MRKLKKAVGSGADGKYHKFLQMLKTGNDQGAALQFGQTLIKGAALVLAPQQCLVLGEALADAVFRLEQKNSPLVTDGKRQAFYWLYQAYEAGLLRTPEEIIKLVIVGSDVAADCRKKIYEIIKSTLDNIECGVCKQPSPFVMHAFYEYFAPVAEKTGDIAAAFHAAQQSYRYAVDLRERVDNFGKMLFYVHHTEISATELFNLSRAYNDIFADVVPYVHDTALLSRELAGGGRRIRIGYLSPDCRQHVAAKFFVALLKYADRTRFEVFMYSGGKMRDRVTDVIAAAVEHFVDVSDMDFATAAAKIYADKIDILVDLAGHTANSFLPVLAYKPAPVQMSGIGDMATTGLKTVDYYITDRVVDPPGNEAFFTERPLFLTGQFSYTPSITGDAVPNCADAPCLANGFVTFGCFNRYNKITDKMLGAWREILNVVPDARLLLKSADYSDNELTATAKMRFGGADMPLERIVFEAGSADYMRRYQSIDIALDTYPYTGGGTTCDALYMGVPVVSLYGERRNMRFSLGILANIGLADLAVDSYEKYVALAVNLARDFDLVQALHKKIRPLLQNSTVGRGDLYTRELEAKYAEIMGNLIGKI